MKHRRVIRYLGINPLSSNEGEKTLKYYSVPVEGDFIKIYSNSIFKLCTLDKSHLVFLIFLFSQVDDDCVFRNGQKLRKKFEEFCYHGGHKIVGSKTVSRWLTDMVENEVLVKLNGRGKHMLSPVFFHRDTDRSYNERERALRERLEKPIRNMAAKFRAEALADKLLDEILKGVFSPDP